LNPILTPTPTPSATPPSAHFATLLIRWQKSHGRHGLPWQHGGSQRRDAYRIWLSEIMLQQTRVATVIPYYERFLRRFPDVATLAAAPVEDVMALWSGLGYYARGRNLHRAAREIVALHAGAFPRRLDAIEALPGIGRSTAAAIAVFAFGTRAAILDGNVKRVLARVFGIRGFPGDKAVERQLWALAESLLPTRDRVAYTQGLMDLGATVCTRGRPACSRCPLASLCAALRSGRVAELPAARAKRERPRRTVILLILLKDGAVLLERRPPSGIWGGLLSLPELDGDAHAMAARRYGCRIGATRKLPPVHHAFTHFHLEIVPLLCAAVELAVHAGESGALWLGLDETATAALPAPVRRILAGLGEFSESGRAARET
jgi:A/G-specific adenine glycosylase